MHESSLANMQTFVDRYVRPARVLDVGASDVNGSYRELFAGAEYVGLDIAPGPGVDVVGWDAVTPESFDYVISGQTFEHAEDDETLIRRMAGALKPGGYCCVIAPSDGPKHGYPDDYRRYRPEDMIRLADLAGLDLIETYINGNAPWWDCVMVAKKRERQS